MTKKKPLNLSFRIFKMGPSIISGLLLLPLPQLAQGMCNFPHNPAVYCTLLDTNEISQMNESGCRIKAQLKKLYRPKNVYSYSKSLERTDYREVASLDPINPFEDIYTDAETCRQSRGQKNIAMAVKLNCEDENSEIPQGAWVQIPLKGPVLDPWTKAYVDIDCSFLGE